MMDIQKVKSEMVNWIRDWVNSSGNNQTKVVIGISGGKDSSCIAYALVEALGKERVYGVLMPNGEQKDISDSMRIVNALGIDYSIVNIKSTYDALSKEIEKVSKLKCKTEPRYNTNTPARIRMTTLYGIAAALGNARVVNTCNLSEDLVGYSTLYGDSAGDFSPLGKLFVDEVMLLADSLGVPKDLAYKTPSDGMCGKSDEDNLGFTYDDIKRVYLNETTGMKFDLVEKIQKKMNGMAWKAALQNLPTFQAGKFRG